MRIFPALIALLLLMPSCVGAGETVTDRPFAEARWIGVGDPAAEHQDARFAFRTSVELPMRPVATLPTADDEGWLTVSPEAGGFTALTFDLGWNLSAFPRIEVRDARGGEILDSAYGSLLDKEGRPHLLEPGSGLDRWIAPAGEASWQSFLLRGYRLHTVKVRAAHPLRVRVTAVIAHHDVPAPLRFECSDQGLTEAWSVTDRTLRATMLDAFVDNNWREQTQWLHDGCAGALGAWATYGDTVLRALRAATAIAAFSGDGVLAAHCKDRATRLARVVEQRFWSQEHGGWVEHIAPCEQVERDVLAGRPADWLDDPWQQGLLKFAEKKQPTACTRHGNALALALKLGDPEQQASAAHLLVQAFEPADVNNNGMSPLWTEKIFGSLFDSGRDPDAIRLLQGSYGDWATGGTLHWPEGWGRNPS